MSVPPLPPAGGDDGRDEQAGVPEGVEDWVARLSPTALVAVAGAAPDPGDDVATWVGQLLAVERLIAWGYAARFALVATRSPYDDPDDVGWAQRHSFLEELQVALRVGEGTARRLADTALLLAPGGPFAPMHAALEAGAVGEGHVRMLASGTVNVVDDPKPIDPTVGPGRSRADKLAEITARVLGRATRETVGKFHDTVAAAVCAVDAEAEAARRAAARDTRDVSVVK